MAYFQQKLDVADDDIMLINKRLDEEQGMFFGALSICKYYSMSMTLRIVY